MNAAVVNFIVILLIKEFYDVNSFQCMTEHNSPVDWFMIYKFPTLKHSNKLVKAGVAYMYMTSDYHNEWIVSNKSINDSDSLIGNTLSSLYSKKPFYILYNDQPPRSKGNKNKGHNKGVIIAGDGGGMWLVHSVPQFPDLKQASYSFPRTGSVYGQSFLCISMNLDNLNIVGRQLQYNEAEIYDKNILSNLTTKIPELVSAAQQNTINKPPWFNEVNLFSFSNAKFSSYAKSKRFGKELYEDWLAPALNTNLYVESWPNGADKLASNCSKPFKVYNIESINITVAGVAFNRTHDHSKWTVSAVSSNTNWLCIGDINRMKHQEVRGGGTVCINNKKITKNYQKLVGSIENCAKH